jgi:hypothetical protein
MRVSPESWAKLVSGEVSVEAFAAQQGVTVEEARALREKGFSRLETRKRRSWRGAALAFVLVLVPGAALAQLVTFQADQPAQASQVNGNFNQLRTWLEGKVGTVGVAGITTTTVLASSSITTAGALTAGATTVNGNLTVSGTTGLSGTTTAGTLSATTLTATTATLTNATITTGTINGVNIRVKAGNNGSVNCDSYCANAGFGGFAGACVGIKLPAGTFSNDCAFVPGAGPGQLTCLCATF